MGGTQGVNGAQSGNSIIKNAQLITVYVGNGDKREPINIKPNESISYHENADGSVGGLKNATLAKKMDITVGLKGGPDILLRFPAGAKVEFDEKGNLTLATKRGKNGEEILFPNPNNSALVELVAQNAPEGTTQTPANKAAPKPPASKAAPDHESSAWISPEEGITFNPDDNVGSNIGGIY